MNRHYSTLIVASLAFTGCSSQPTSEAELDFMLDEATEKCGFKRLGVWARGRNEMVLSEPSHFRGLKPEEGAQLACVLSEIDHIDGLRIEYRGKPVDIEMLRSYLPKAGI